MIKLRKVWYNKPFMHLYDGISDYVQNNLDKDLIIYK